LDALVWAISELLVEGTSANIEVWLRLVDKWPVADGR
jgi:hypothetical protein